MYVLAVSGGVDSVVLLDKVASDASFRRLNFADSNWPEDFVVAHFDHGIRDDSRDDLDFVRSLADGYGVRFESGIGDLKKDSSEDSARTKRYEFLFKLAKKFDGAMVVTAHHQNDLVETILINLLRGTGWRGLSPMSSEVYRPLLSTRKTEILSYAVDKKLEWREDSTNSSDRYFRNRVRSFLADIPAEFHDNLVRLYSLQKSLRVGIETETMRLLNSVVEHGQFGLDIPRYFLVMLPVNVASEVLNLATDGKLTNPQLDQLILFSKVGKSGKKMLFGDWQFYVTKRVLSIQKIRSSN